MFATTDTYPVLFQDLNSRLCQMNTKRAVCVTGYKWAKVFVFAIRIPTLQQSHSVITFSQSYVDEKKVGRAFVK